MLPVNDLKFLPPFLGLQNEGEAIDALDTILQKKIVTKTENEKDRRRENLHRWNSIWVIFFIHYSHFIGQQQKTGAGRRITVPEMDKHELFDAFYVSEKKK